MNPSGLVKLTTDLGQAPDPTLSGRHHRAHAIRFTPDVELGIRLGHTRGRHRKLRESIEPAQRPSLEPTLGLERLRLAGDPNRVRLRGEGSDLRARTLAGDQPTPRRLDVRTERRHSTQTGHDNTSLRETHNLTTITVGRERTGRRVDV
jgi:hypothetical protein